MRRTFEELGVMIDGSPMATLLEMRNSIPTEPLARSISSDLTSKARL